MKLSTLLLLPLAFALAFTAAGSSTIRVAWDPPTNGVPVQGYVLEWASGNPTGPWQSIPVGLTNSATFTNTNDANGTSVRVIAESTLPDGSLRRGYSDSIFVPRAVLPGVPAGLKAAAFTLGPGSNSVAALTWVAATGSPIEYLVEWRRGNELTWQRIATGKTSADVANPIDTGLTLYRVAARNAYGIGPWTPELRMTRAEAVLPPSGVRTTIVQFSE